MVRALMAECRRDLRERVCNLAVSDGRTISTDGSVPPFGSTVDVENLTYADTIGELNSRSCGPTPTSIPQNSRSIRFES